VARRTQGGGRDAVTTPDAEKVATRKRRGSALRDDTPRFRVVKDAPKKKADKVREAYLKDPNARPIDVAKATGVDPAYVWDIRQAMRRKGLLPMPETTAEVQS